MNKNKFAAQEPEMGEIDLIEFFVKLWRRKALIGGVTAAFVAISIAYVFVASPTFQTIAEISVGSASDNKRLVSDINLLTFADANVTAELPRAKPGATPNVKVSVTSPDKNAALRVINEVAAQIVGGHKEIIDSNLINAQKSLVEMQDALDKINSVGAKTDMNMSGVLAEKSDLSKIISPYGYKYTSIVDERSLERVVQIKPRKTATIVIGAIAGLVFGVFLALLLDAIKDFRAKRKKVVA